MSTIRRLQEAEPFNSFPDHVFQEIRAAAILKRYPARTFIVRQNDPPTGFLYVIKEGLVEITLLTPGGIDMVVDYRQEGSFFGGTPIFTGEPYTGGARTVKPTECYLIPEEILKRLEKGYPQIRTYFTRIVFSRIRRLYSDIVTDHSQQALTQVEAYPFKKRLSEIMVTPVETCMPTETVRQVARRMTAKKIGCLPVLDGENRLTGIITAKDLIEKVIAPENAEPANLTAAEIMQSTPFFMPPETYMYEAMTFLISHRIKHLPVVDRGELVGIVSLRDLLRYRSQKSMLIVGNIREENRIAGLAAIRREIVTVASSLLCETRSTPEVMEILSYLHHSIIRRVYEICLAEMEADGYRMPDIRFCFLLMGSGGRREMLLGPDQDNGFIYEDVPDEKLAEVEAFFAPFGERLVEALSDVGYPLCHGKVMANNPSWRGRLGDWEERIRDWVNDPEPQKVRYSSIFFDFVPIAGDPALAHELRETVFRQIRDFQGFLYHMMSLDLRYKVPVGLLGRFILEKDEDHKGELSLKQGGTVYIVDCIRMFALEKEIQAVTTLERLKQLVQLNVFAAETAEHIRAAFEALSFLRLRHEIALVEEGKAPSHYLDPHALSRNEQDLLRESFNAVSKLQDATKRHFGRTPF
jgi:CBS domain-containing protein